MENIKKQAGWYIALFRLDKPIGILLLLWPTLTALWIAAEGHPSLHLIIIFSLGTLLMRSAGCAINDVADREFDRHVARTANRPVTQGKLSVKEALIAATVLVLLAFLLVLQLNILTILLSVPALLIAIAYPYFKRFFAIPQAWLGIAFGFGIPMAFAAVLNQIPPLAWYLLIANIFWTLAYDTEYAMVDREDDLKIGIKTSAITFGQQDIFIIMLCYAAMLTIMLGVGYLAGLGKIFLMGWLGAVGCVLWHFRLIRHRDPVACFQAFRHNNYLGAILFAGIMLDYALN